MVGRLAQPLAAVVRPAWVLLSCPLSLALSEGISIDMSSGTIDYRRETGILTEGLSSPTRPDVEVHYDPESGTPSPAPY